MTWRTAHRREPGLSDQTVRTVTSVLRASTVAPPKATVAVPEGGDAESCQPPGRWPTSSASCPDGSWSRTKRPVLPAGPTEATRSPELSRRGVDSDQPLPAAHARDQTGLGAIDERQQRRCLAAGCPQGQYFHVTAGQRGRKGRPGQVPPVALWAEQTDHSRAATATTDQRLVPEVTDRGARPQTAGPACPRPRQPVLAHQCPPSGKAPRRHQHPGLVPLVYQRQGPAPPALARASGQPPDRRL